MKKLSAFLAIAVFLTVSSSAFAGFINFDCNFPDDNEHTWSFLGYNGSSEPVGGFGNDTDVLNGLTEDLTGSLSYELSLTETMYAIGSDQVNASYYIDEDPAFHITKTVTNDTAYAWTSYGLTLDGNGGATFVELGNTDSDIYNSYSLSTLSINFYNGTVAIGQTVTLDFDINVDYTGEGTFGFCLTQNPVPEPGTMLLLGLGGLLLRKRR